MAEIIAVVNQKGGVGKTTSCINVCAALAYLDKNVLLIDCDPQGNATTGSGLDKNSLSSSLMDVLLENTEITQSVFSSSSGYDLIPANSELTVAEVQLLKQEGREFFLRNKLASLSRHYDYIFLDCPPSLNMLTLNALTAAASVIIPMQCEYFALEGLTSLLDTIETLKKTANPELYIKGLLRTLFDGRNSLGREVSDQLLEHFPDKVYNTIIPRNVRLAEAPSYGQSIFMYDPNSSGGQAYLALAYEILKKEGHIIPLKFLSSATTTSAPLLKKRSTVEKGVS